MPAIARPPDTAPRWWRYRVELLWLLFAGLNYAAIIAWPTWELIPFHLVWISLTLVYGFRVWPVRAALAVAAGVVVLTVASIFANAFMGIRPWRELFEVPVVSAMLLAMVWYARRRVAALEVAQNRAEERRSMLERQEQFIHDASHELRTPVTIARGHLELIGADAENRSEVDVALDELGRIDAIIERLLVLATAGQPEFFTLSDVEVEPFLEDVFMRWSETAPRTWLLGPLTTARLRVDPIRLRAALDALLENAVKYTQERDAIELRAREQEDGTVVIEVEDEGCGVPAEAFERIFDRFAQADAARSGSAGGVGLGLAIVDAIAKGHGGRCTVAGTARGSVFALQLPSAGPAAGHPESRDRGLVEPPGVHDAVDEDGRRGDDARADTGAEVSTYTR